MIQVNRSLPRAETKAYEVYALLGGEDGGGKTAFVALMDAFYRGVEGDPVLRSLYPEDLTEGRDNLLLFLIQFFGGPAGYAEKRGDPRLRLRHMPFAIGIAERDAWMRHMTAALDEVPSFAPVREIVQSYFQNATNFLQNRDA